MQMRVDGCSTHNGDQKMLTARANQFDRSLNLREPVVKAYFEAFNSENFDGVARLFAQGGTLQPPFEDAIIGAEAIAAYLKAEAGGIRAIPHQENQKLQRAADSTVKVTGEVQTPLFSVNASWTFTLNPNSEILNVTIELLASPQDLFNLQQFR